MCRGVGGTDSFKRRYALMVRAKWVLRGDSVVARHTIMIVSARSVAARAVLQCELTRENNHFAFFISTPLP